MWLRAGTVVSGGGLLSPGWLSVAGSRIAAVQGHPPAVPDVTDLGDDTVLLPGFVDQHCHGGGGASFAGDADEIATASRFHLRNGTTTVTASLVTDATSPLVSRVRRLAHATREGLVCGVHLEGPWLAPGRCGAHDPSLLRDPDAGEVDRLLAAADGALRMVTLAPERPGSLAAVAALRGADVRVAIGHTDADAATVAAALAAGADVATHLFNAMPPIHHRRPGPVPVLLGDAASVVELVCDGVHVDPWVLRLAIAAAGPSRVALVTDATAAAGLGDVDLSLGPLAVRVRDGVARLADGETLAGSTLTMADAVRFAVDHLGVALDDAAEMAAATPARVLGLTDRGRLSAGLRADIVVLDAALQVRDVLHGGVWVR